MTTTKITIGKFNKFYVPATVCHDLSAEQVNNFETPEVEIVADKGEVFGRQSYDLRNITTGAIYRNISIETIILRYEK